MNGPSPQLQSLHEAYDAQIRAFKGHQLPSSLMDCFGLMRDAGIRKKTKCFSASFQSHLLALVNELRGVKDSKDDFAGMFDPSMYFTWHAEAWEKLPGTEIVLPALNTTVIETQPKGSQLRIMAEQEYSRFASLSESFMDEDLIGLAQIAAAGYGDSNGRLATTV